jgi:hypothetical protein
MVELGDGNKFSEDRPRPLIAFVLYWNTNLHN